MVHVPYHGAQPALVDVMSGNVDMFFDTLATSVPLYRAGKLKLLGVASPERVSAGFPDVPTIANRGGGLSLDHLVRHGGPARHSGAWSTRSIAMSTDPAQTGDRQKVAGDRTRAGGRHAGGRRQVHRRRNPAMGQGDPRGAHHAGLADAGRGVAQAALTFGPKERNTNKHPFPGCGAARIGAPLIRDRSNVRECRLSLRRSRFCSAPFRFAACCAAPGKRTGVEVATRTPVSRMRCSTKWCAANPGSQQPQRLPITVCYDPGSAAHHSASLRAARRPGKRGAGKPPQDKPRAT